MKRIISTLTLLATVTWAGAIGFGIVPELSGPNHLVVDAYWGEYLQSADADASYTEWNNLWAIEAHDWASVIEVRIMPWDHHQTLLPGLRIEFSDWHDRSFDSATFYFNGDIIEPREHGARFIWGVPDSGNTGILFGLTCGGLMAFAFGKRKEV